MGDNAESVNLLGKEFSSINKFAGSVRSLFFEFLYVILKDDEMSKIINSGLILLQFFQIYYYAFHPVINSVWDTSVAKDIASVFGYPGIMHIYRNNSSTSFSIVYYIGIILVFIFCLGFLYSFVTLKRQKPIQGIVVGSLRIIMNLFLTVLYMPFLDSFIIVMNCTTGTSSITSSSISVLQLYPDTQCWTGMHIFQFAAGVVCTILIIIINYFLSFLYFDGIHNDNKVNSRRNNRGILSLYIYQTVLVFCYNFLYDSSYRGVLVFIYLAGSIFTFYMLHMNSPFNEPIIAKCWSFLSAVNIWTAIMLTKAQLTENIIFHGIVYAWAIGLPLLWFIVFWSPTDKNKSEASVNVNVNKFQDAQEVIDHAIYVQKLIQNDMKKTKSGQLLNGYIEFHNKTCLVANCPLKRVKFTNSVWKKAKKNEVKGPNTNNNNNGSKTDKRYQFCQEMISKLFETGISKFPTNIPIRIYYSVFLMKVIKSKQHALNEVLDAENFKCSLDERFVLYYIRRSIEREISEISNQEGEDYGEQRNLEGKINHFRAAMEQTVTLLMEFWSQFSDDKPDLIKLYDIGSKLFPLKLLVDDMWKKISRGKGEQIPKVFRIYSKYLIDIFNDKQGGVELLEKASKMETNFNNRKEFHFNYSSEVNIDGQEDGIIFMTMEEEKLGQIMACNLTVACLFGYSKTELINRNVNMLQPYLYSKNHDDILKHYLENGDKTQGKDKNLHIYGKNKSQYIFAISINIKPVYHALKDGNEFFGVFKKEKMIKNLAYVHINEKGIIKDISASCINILGIDMKTISLEQININKLFEDLDDKKDEYMSKQGKQTEYIFPKINEDTVVFRKSDKVTKVNIQMSELRFKCKGEELVGRILKIEQLQEKIGKSAMKSRIQQAAASGGSQIKKVGEQSFLGVNNTQLGLNNTQNLLNTTQIMNLAVPNNNLTGVFQFKLCIQDDQEIIYNGEFYEGALYSEMGPNQTYIHDQSDLGINDSKLGNNELNVSHLANANVIVMKSTKAGSEHKNNQLDMQQIVVQEKLYSEGIRTLRLVNNDLHDIEKFKEEDSEEEEEEKEEVESQQRGAKQRHQKIGNSAEEEGFDYESSGLNSTKELNEELDKQSESAAVVSLKYFSVFVIAAMILIASIDFGLKRVDISDERSALQDIVLSSNRIGSFSLISSLVRELSQLADGTGALITVVPGTALPIRLPQYSTSTTGPATYASDKIVLTKKLTAAITEIESLNIQLQSRGDSITTKMMFTNGGSTQVFDLNAASQQMISKAHNIKEKTYQNILDNISNDADSFFVIYNSLNDYTVVLLNDYNSQNDKVVTKISDLESNSQVFLITSVCVMVFFSIVLSALLGKTIYAKQLILSVFLDIPEKTAKFLYSKCENFLAQLGSGDEDDVHSEVDFFIDDRDDAQEARSSLFGKKRKKFKNADRGNVGFLLKMLIITIGIEAYFFINFFVGRSQTNVMSGLLTEFNYTTIAESYYSLALNAERQLITEDAWPALNRVSTVNMPLMVNMVYTIDSTIHEEHARNTNYHDNSAGYLTAFETIMFDNACTIVNNRLDDSKSTCEAFGSGVVKQGMITVIIRYFQLIRYFKDRYDWVIANPTTPFTFSQFTGYSKQTYSATDIQLDNFMNLLRIPEAYELLGYQLIYIRSTLRYLQQVFLSEMNLLFDNYNVQRVLLFILFIILLLIAAFLCWTPFLSQLNKEIWSTKCLLSFIPVDEMTKIKSIGNFIREYILDRKI